MLSIRLRTSTGLVIYLCLTFGAWGIRNGPNPSQLYNQSEKFGCRNRRLFALTTCATDSLREVRTGVMTPFFYVRGQIYSNLKRMKLQRVRQSGHSWPLSVCKTRVWALMSFSIYPLNGWIGTTVRLLITCVCVSEWPQAVTYDFNQKWSLGMWMSGSGLDEWVVIIIKKTLSYCLYTLGYHTFTLNPITRVVLCDRIHAISGTLTNHTWKFPQNRDTDNCRIARITLVLVTWETLSVWTGYNASIDMGFRWVASCVVTGFAEAWSEMG